MKPINSNLIPLHFYKCSNKSSCTTNSKLKLNWISSFWPCTRINGIFFSFQICLTQEGRPGFMDVNVLDKVFFWQQHFLLESNTHTSSICIVWTIFNIFTADLRNSNIKYTFSSFKFIFSTFKHNLLTFWINLPWYLT